MKIISYSREPLLCGGFNEARETADADKAIFEKVTFVPGLIFIAMSLLYLSAS